MDRRVEELLIGNLNVKNKKENRFNYKVDNEIPSDILKDHLENVSYDIIGIEEITKGFLKKINIKGYEAVCFYRFSNFFTLPKLIDYNEGNVIFTKRQVIKKEVHYLSFFPSIPRVATCLLLAINDEAVWVINTHLERKNKKIQKKQLQQLEKIIKKYKSTHPVILMGDFNMSIYNKDFKEFIKNLESIGIKRVEIDEKTQVVRKNAIDHIFIPAIWSIIEKGLINDDKINQITDHFGIFVKIKQKEIKN